MEVVWQFVKSFYESHKDWFYAFGSLAGVLAFFRPLLESRLQRDQERASRLMERIPEQLVINLESQLYQSRLVPSDAFRPFDQLEHELDTSQDGVRFSGPTAKFLLRETKDMVSAYRKLRLLVQVPMWDTGVSGPDGDRFYFWRFNKNHFIGADGVPGDYAKHLDQCVGHVRSIRAAQQRFQIAADVHLLEVPLARLLISVRSRHVNAKRT